jgi:hypothetical protein
MPEPGVALAGAAVSDFTSFGKLAFGGGFTAAPVALGTVTEVGPALKLARVLALGLLASHAAWMSLPSALASGTWTPDTPLKIDATPTPESTNMPSASPANFIATGAHTLP